MAAVLVVSGALAASSRGLTAFRLPLSGLDLTASGLAAPILAERIRPATDLRHAISLNDSFRFTRELFGGDAARMNEVLRRLGDAPTLNSALELFAAEVQADDDNPAVADFVELLHKYFN